MKYLEALQNFYETIDGADLQRKISNPLRESLSNRKTLIIGYGGEFLDLLDNDNLFFAIISGQPVQHWPKVRPFKTIITDEDRFPFAPCSWDAIIVIHHAEYSSKIIKFLFELDRILKKNGRLIMIMSNGITHKKEKHSARKISYILSQMDFSITKIIGSSKKLHFWPYEFVYKIGALGQYWINIFPIFSDVIVINAKKMEGCASMIGFLKEQYGVHG